MAVLAPKRKPKKSKQVEVEEQNILDSFLYRFLNRISIALLLLLLVFVWSCSTTIISGSNVHVCVTSRKLNNLYCFSAGTQPANYSVLDSSRNEANSTENVSIATRKIAVSDSAVNSVSNAVFIMPVIRNGVDKAQAEAIANGRKEVEGQMAILRSYIPKSKPSNCDGRGIYVYDLPPKFNKDLLISHCSEMMWLDFCKFLTNNGMGEPIPELGKDWYNTNQYALEPIYHTRVLNHPCRVRNIEGAKLFYVPYYGGLDVLRWHFKKVPHDVKDKLSEELVEWLKQQSAWNRNSGSDHVFVLGKITWDFRRWGNYSWGTRFLELNEIQNPVKLLIERHPWKINDIGVPHPTYFHPSSDDDIRAWQTNITQVQRKNLVSFAGASRQSSHSIRSTLIEQCISAVDKCTFVDCRDKACVSPAPVVSLFMESEFCLQPVGDSPTRKSVFDSLVAGCIPVVFDPFTAHYQYPWHLPEDHSKYSVYIDQEEVRMGEVNVVERLMKIPLKERQEMRKYTVDELMPRLLYSNPNGKLEEFEDAFTVSMNNLLEMVINRLPS